MPVSDWAFISYTYMMWKRFKLNSKYIFKKSLSWTTMIYAILGFIAVFVSLDEVHSFVGISGFGCKLLASVLVLLLTFFLCFVVSTICVLRIKKVKVMDVQNGKAVYVVYGSLFTEDIVKKTDKRRNICFAVNHCFDTIVDNQLIMENSLHGKAFKRLYSVGVYTQDTLNDAIQSSIIRGAKSTMLTRNQKTIGNLKRYGVGTGADLTVSESLHYFLIGIGKMDVNLRNSADNSGYCMAVQKMIEFFDTFSQGFPILMPIVGAGLTRLDQDSKDILKYLIQSLVMNRSHLCSDIYIVLQEEDRERIAIADLI